MKIRLWYQVIPNMACYGILTDGEGPIDIYLQTKRSEQLRTNFEVVKSSV